MAAESKAALHPDCITEPNGNLAEQGWDPESWDHRDKHVHDKLSAHGRSGNGLRVWRPPSLTRPDRRGS